MGTGRQIWVFNLNYVCKIMQSGIPVFLRILVPALAGIMIGLSVPHGKSGMFLFAALALVFLILLIITHFHYVTSSLYLKCSPSIIVQCFLLSVFAFNTASRHPSCIHGYFDKVKCSYLSAEVSSAPVYTASGVRFFADVKFALRNNSSVRANGKIIIQARTDYNSGKFEIGNQIILPASYRPPTPPLNPYECDYKQYLENQHVYYQFFCDVNDIRKIGGPPFLHLRHLATRWRTMLCDRLNRYIENKADAAIAATLILGNKESLQPDILKAYSQAGVFHVLSVSGMHVALVVQILMTLLFFMKTTKAGRLIRCLLAIVGVWLYTALTGMSVAACRAAIMITFVMIGRIWNGENDTGNSVAAAAVILLVADPYYLLDVGFELSFLAVFGIIYLDPLLRKYMRSRHAVLNYLSSCVSISVAAQLATFPLILYYFNQFPLYFLLANLIVIIPVAVIMTVGIFFLVMPVHSLSVALAAILGKTIHLLNSLLIMISDLPMASINICQAGLWFYLLIYLLLALLVFAFLKRSGRALLFSAAAGLILTSAQAFVKISVAESSSIVFYSLRNEMAVGFRSGKQIGIIATVPPHSKTFEYSIMPLIRARCLRLQTCRFVKSGGSSAGNSQIYRFCGRKIMICERFGLLRLSCNEQVDYLLLPAAAASDLVVRGRKPCVSNILFYGAPKTTAIREALARLRREKVPFQCLRNSGAIEVNLQ